MGKFDDKLLLDVNEMCEYTGFGETKVRQILSNPKSTYTVRNGSRIYAHKKLFDQYLEKCAKLHLKL